MSGGRWPVRYRAAHRLHSFVNRVHYDTGEHAITGWLNQVAASLWVPWWVDSRRNASREDWNE